MGPQRIRRDRLLALIGAALICGCSGTIGGGGNESSDDAVAKELCVVDTPIRRLTRTTESWPNSTAKGAYPRGR